MRDAAKTPDRTPRIDPIVSILRDFRLSFRVKLSGCRYRAETPVYKETYLLRRKSLCIATVVFLVSSAAFASADAPQEESVAKAYREAYEQLKAKSGAQSASELNRLIAPAVKAQADAARKSDEELRARLKEEFRARKARQGSPEAGGTMRQARREAEKTEPSRGAAPVSSDAPIVDPASVPKYIEFHRESADAPAAVKGAGQVDEIQFDGPRKAPSRPSVSH